MSLLQARNPSLQLILASATINSTTRHHMMINNWCVHAHTRLPPSLLTR